MATFYLRLNAPRPTFGQDMTPEEVKIMQEHGAYWREVMEKGHVIVFGMVGDPKGVFGMGVAEFDSLEQARAFADRDPTITSRRGFSIDILPMPRGAVHR